MVLRKESQKFWRTPNKDFSVGRDIFSKIIEKRPNDYWATLSLGGCYVWDKQPREGEPYVRKALSIDEVYLITIIF
jgi:hypothetical protein